MRTTIEGVYENNSILLPRALQLPERSAVQVVIEAATSCVDHNSTSEGLTLAEPRKRLYAEIFEGKSPQSITTNVAEGILAVICNVERILTDVDCLLAEGRIASASFLLATADEEFAKIFILLDACRLNPAKHSSTLRCLCRAFYDHIQKHAYNRIRRNNLLVDNMAKASELWRLEVKGWWPESGDPEDDVPALPHDTVFDREMPLYVDWDYHSKEWVQPDNKTNARKFANRSEPSRLEHLRTELAEAKTATTSKLLSADALMAVNDVWSGWYVNDKTATHDIERLTRQLMARVENEQKSSEEELRRSPLINWPLYYFTTLKA